MSTALISAYKKDEHLADFVRDLVGLGWNILASSGTKKFLDGQGIPSSDVADLVGEPILGHRVVTLDRRIYAAILARTDNPDDRAELARLNINAIGLVCVSLYPLADELRSPDVTYQSALEKIDIGGPTLLRAAAKGGCIVVFSPSQYEGVIKFLEYPPDQSLSRGIVVTKRYLARLASEAEREISAYTALAADFYESVEAGDFPQRFRA